MRLLNEKGHIARKLPMTDSASASDYRIKKMRRRIEDYLRKTSDINILLVIAKVLKIKIED